MMTLVKQNSYILKDLDLLSKLAEHQLVKVCLSITTLQEDLRRFLEPRTSSIKQRFQAVEQLTTHGIPVNVMAAPIIPGLNEHELMGIARQASEAGSLMTGSTITIDGGHVLSDL